MLVLTRKTGEAIWIGGVRVVVTQIKGGQVKIGVEADREVVVVREELVGGGGSEQTRSDERG